MMENEELVTSGVNDAEPPEDCAGSVETPNEIPMEVTMQQDSIGPPQPTMNYHEMLQKMKKNHTTLDTLLKQALQFQVQLVELHFTSAILLDTKISEMRLDASLASEKLTGSSSSQNKKNHDKDLDTKYSNICQDLKAKLHTYKQSISPHPCSQSSLQ